MDLRPRALCLTLVLVLLAGSALAQTMIRRGPDPPPGLAIEHDVPGYLDVMPEAERVVDLRLANAGNETLDLRIDAMDPEGLVELEATPSRVALAPGENATVALRVRALPDALMNETTRVMLVAVRDSHSQMKDVPLPVRIGEPCPECVPDDEPDGGGFFVTGPGPGGTGPGGTTERRVSNATRPAPTQTEPAEDPSLDVPAPGPLVLVGALAVASVLRRRSLGLLVALAILSPTVLAQTADSRTLALTSSQREGEDVVVAARNHRTLLTKVTISLVGTDGRLLAPEQTRLFWNETETVVTRFANVNATQGELRIAFTRDTGADAVEKFPLAFPAAPAARLDVTEVAMSAGREIQISLTNAGTRTSPTTRAHLEDANGTRVGAPLARDVPPLEPGETANLSFVLEEEASRITLVLESADPTRRITLDVPAPVAPRIELLYASLENGAFEATIANLGAIPSGGAVAHLETKEGARIGSPSALAVGSLPPESSRDLAFALPADTEEVRLVIDDGVEPVRFDIRLDELTKSGPDIEVTTDLPSREAAPGDAANFDLTIANEGKEVLVSLRAEGLPDGYQASFSVAGSAVRTLVLAEGGSRPVTVTVVLPEGASRDAGDTHAFSVVVEADGAEVARLPLTITVKGEPRLELAGQNWFASAAAGEATRVQIEIRNPGSAEARDVDLAVSAPAGWRVEFSPARIDALGPGSSRDVEIEVTPEAEATAGRYVLDVSAGNDDISARARSLSVEIAAEEASRVGWLAGAGIAALAAVALVVKLRRK